MIILITYMFETNPFQNLISLAYNNWSVLTALIIVSILHKWISSSSSNSSKPKTHSTILSWRKQYRSLQKDTVRLQVQNRDLTSQNISLTDEIVVLNNKVHNMSKDIVNLQEEINLTYAIFDEIKNIVESPEYTDPENLGYTDEYGWTLDDLKTKARELGVEHLHHYTLKSRKALAQTIRYKEQLDLIFKTVKI